MNDLSALRDRVLCKDNTFCMSTRGKPKAPKYITAFMYNHDSDVTTLREDTLEREKERKWKKGGEDNL